MTLFIPGAQRELPGVSQGDKCSTLRKQRKNKNGIYDSKNGICETDPLRIWVQPIYFLQEPDLKYKGCQSESSTSDPESSASANGLGTVFFVLFVMESGDWVEMVHAEHESGMRLGEAIRRVAKKSGKMEQALKSAFYHRYPASEHNQNCIFSEEEEVATLMICSGFSITEGRREEHYFIFLNIQRSEKCGDPKSYE